MKPLSHLNWVHSVVDVKDCAGLLLYSLLPCVSLPQAASQV